MTTPSPTAKDDLKLTAALAIRSIAKSLQKSSAALDEAVAIISGPEASHTKSDCNSALHLVASQTSEQMRLQLQTIMPRRPRRQLLQFHSSLQFLCSLHPRMRHSIDANKRIAALNFQGKSRLDTKQCNMIGCLLELGYDLTCALLQHATSLATQALRLF